MAGTGSGGGKVVPPKQKETEGRQRPGVKQRRRTIGEKERDREVEKRAQRTGSAERARRAGRTGVGGGESHGTGPTGAKKGREGCTRGGWRRWKERTRSKRGERLEGLGEPGNQKDDRGKEGAS